MGFKRTKLQERCEMSEAVFGHEGLSESLMTTFLQNFLCMFPNRCPPPPLPSPKLHRDTELRLLCAAFIFKIAIMSRSW